MLKLLVANVVIFLLCHFTLDDTSANVPNDFDIIR